MAEPREAPEVRLVDANDGAAAQSSVAAGSMPRPLWQEVFALPARVRLSNGVSSW
jgi:hypothetical protein